MPVSGRIPKRDLPLGLQLPAAPDHQEAQHDAEGESRTHARADDRPQAMERTRANLDRGHLHNPGALSGRHCTGEAAACPVRLE